MSKITRAIVRPTVTLAMAGAVIWGFVVGKIPAEQFTTLAFATVTFWFVSRDNEKNPPGG